jgi:hypothetical protein
MKTLLLRSLSHVYIFGCLVAVFAGFTPTPAFASPANNCSGAVNASGGCAGRSCLTTQPACALTGMKANCNCGG